MANSDNPTKNEQIESKFDEEEAYFELCMIIAEAVQTQNFDNLEARIANWKNRYPLSDFLNPEIIRKIKIILSREYLEYLLGKYLANKILQDNQKEKEAFEELQKIIEKAKKNKDFNLTQKDIQKWRKNHSLYSFNRFYRAKICKLISLDYISSITEKKKRDEAVEEFEKIKQNANDYDSTKLQEVIDEWTRTYPSQNFHAEFNKEISDLIVESLALTTEKLNQETAISEVSKIYENAKEVGDVTALDSILSALSKYDISNFDDIAKTEILRLTTEATLISSTNDNLKLDTISIPISIDDNISPKQKDALKAFNKIIDKNSHDVLAMLDWIYTYRNIEFPKHTKEYILTQFQAVGYTIPKKSSFAITLLETEQDKPIISYTNFSQINTIREQTVTNYFGMLLYDKDITPTVKNNIESVYIISKQAESIKSIDDEIQEATKSIDDEHKKDGNSNPFSIKNVFQLLVGKKADVKEKPGFEITQEKE